MTLSAGPCWNCFLSFTCNWAKPKSQDTLGNNASYQYRGGVVRRINCKAMAQAAVNFGTVVAGYEPPPSPGSDERDDASTDGADVESGQRVNSAIPTAPLPRGVSHDPQGQWSEDFHPGSQSRRQRTREVLVRVASQSAEQLAWVSARQVDLCTSASGSCCCRGARTWRHISWQDTDHDHLHWRGTLPGTVSRAWLSPCHPAQSEFYMYLQALYGLICTPCTWQASSDLCHMTGQHFSCLNAISYLASTSCSPYAS